MLQEMGKEWTLNKLLLHFEQLAEKEVTKECKRIKLINWILQTQLLTESKQCVVLIERKHWLWYIQEYANSEKVQLKFYRNWSFDVPLLKKVYLV